MAAAPSPATSGIKPNLTKNKQDEKSRPPTVEELLIQIENRLYSSVEHRASLLIAAWSCLGGNIGYFRSIDRVFQVMYRESAMMIFSGHWGKVDILFKRGLSRAIIQYSHSMGSYVKGSEGLCTALVMAVYDPWGDPVISQSLSKDNINLNKVSDFVKSEPRDLLLIRVECLVNAHCEEAAIRLCRSCLQSGGPLSVDTDDDYDAENWRLSFLEWLVRLLFRKRRLDDLVSETSTCSCHDGVRLIYRTMHSNTDDAEPLTESLINLFLVRDLLFNSNYCCTADLMTLWCKLQSKKQKPLSEIQEAARKLLVGHASSSAQFYLFVDILWAKFGISLLPLYLEFYVRGLTSDLNYLEVARQTDKKEYIIEYENHMAAVYFKLSSLFFSINKEISLECLLSAFSLNPTREVLDWIKKMTLQITKEKGIKAIGNSDVCKHNKGTCTHNHNSSLPVKRKAVVMCDQAIQVGDDSFMECENSVNTSCQNVPVPEEEEENARAKKRVALEIPASETEKINELDAQRSVNENVIPVEKQKGYEKSNTENSISEKVLTDSNKEKSSEGLKEPVINLNENNCSHLDKDEEIQDKANFELPLTSINNNINESTSDSDHVHNLSSENKTENSPLKLETDNICSKIDIIEKQISTDQPPIINNHSPSNHINGLDDKIISNCKSEEENANIPLLDKDNCSSRDIVLLSKDIDRNLKSETSTPKKHKSDHFDGNVTTDVTGNICVNGYGESEAELTVTHDHSNTNACNSKNSCRKINTINVQNIQESDKNISSSVEIGKSDSVKGGSEILNHPSTSKMHNSCIPDHTITANLISTETRMTRRSELLKNSCTIPPFTHVVLDSKLPDVSTDLLSDFVTVLESLRNKQLQSSSKWSQIKHLCEDYLEVVSEQRCLMVSLQQNDSVDSEADSTSEISANDFEFNQSNNTVIEDHLADKSHVFKRFMNSEKVTEMATYVNLSDIHCPQIPLEKLFCTDYSSSHPGHKKRHKRHRNHDKNPKKLVLRKLRHGNRAGHDLVKHKKRKKRKGKRGKGHAKKHHSTHNKVDKVHSKNKKKKHKLKKKKEGNSGFISGDYCSDFSSGELMRIVKEHSNSYSKTLATTSKHPHAGGSASSSDSDEPSRKKRKVSFDKKRGKVEKYRDKHKHVKSKSNKHKKKITVESCKASVTNVIHDNPISNDLRAVKDFPHFLQISRVKKLESVQIQQRSVSMVDDSANGASLIPPCVSSPQIKQFVQQNFESYSPDDIMKMQLLMARQQAEVTAGSTTMSSSNQALRKYVCSKMTSQLLSVAQSSKCFVGSDSETSKSPTPNFLDKNATKMENSLKSQGNPQKISANIKHFVIETSKAPYKLPNSNLTTTVTNSIIPINISANQYSEARNLIGTMLNSNIRCPTSQMSPQVTALSIPFSHNQSGSKMVTSKIIIPLPPSNQMQSGPSSPNLSLIKSENPSFSATSGNSSHSSLIIVKNGNSTQIIQGPQNACNILPCIPNTNVSLSSISGKINPVITKTVPRKIKQTPKRTIQPVAKRTLIKNPPPIKTVMVAPKISNTLPKIIALPVPSPSVIAETTSDNLINSTPSAPNIPDRDFTKIPIPLPEPVKPAIDDSKPSPTIKITTAKSDIKDEIVPTSQEISSLLFNKSESKGIQESNKVDNSLIDTKVITKCTDVSMSIPKSIDVSNTISKIMDESKTTLNSIDSSTTVLQPDSSKSAEELKVFSKPSEVSKPSDVLISKSTEVSKAISNILEQVNLVTESCVSDEKVKENETLLDLTKNADVSSVLCATVTEAHKTENISKSNKDLHTCFEKSETELEKSPPASCLDLKATIAKTIATVASQIESETNTAKLSDSEKSKPSSKSSPSVSAVNVEKDKIKKSFTDTSINSSTKSLQSKEKTVRVSNSDILTESESIKTATVDQETYAVNSPDSKESSSSPSKTIGTSKNEQQKQLQPINSVNLTTNIKTSGKANSLNKSDGVTVSEVQTRSFTSISDAVRFSLMDMDDATDSVENQVLQAFQVSHETSQSSPRYDNSSTNDGNGRASPSAVILTTPQSTSTTDLNVSHVSQRFEASVHSSQTEKFTDCQSTVSRSTTWILEDTAINETSQTINLQKSPDIDSSCEGKEEDKPKKKKKRKDRCDPETAHKFWCEICHKGFFSAYNLRRHCRNVHKMALPKGTSDLPFASNTHGHQHIQQGESSSSEIVSSPRLPYGNQSSCVSPKGSDYMLQSPTRENKTQDFAAKVATSQHVTSMQTDFQMQTVSRISGQSSSHISPPVTTKSVQSDFQLPTPTSVSSAHVSPNKLSNVAKSPTTPKFQRLPTPCSTTSVSPMSQISVCGQQSAIQQRQLNQIQTSGLIQPVPSVACQAQQLQAAQCPHFQSKQIAQQRIGQLQLMHHAAQLPAMQHATHSIQKQNPVQQYKKCGSNLQSSKMTETEQIQQTAQLAQTQQILANQQMQKIMQIRQNAIAATGVATQLSLGTAVPGVQSSNVKTATQCFQSQLAVARQAAAVAQLSATQRGPGASFTLTSHDSAAHQFFAPSLQPTQEQSSCSHASFTTQNLVEYSANAPSYPTIRLSSEANDGLEDLEQFLMENMPWSSDQTASHGHAQQSGNRPSSADSLTLAIPTPVSSQLKSKTTISRPKPRKPVATPCSKNLLGNLGRGVKKKSTSKKASKIADVHCPVSKSNVFPQNCVNQQSHGLDLLQMHCDKGTSSDIKQACKPAAINTVNETDSSDSVQCINVGHHTSSKNVSVGINFNTFIPTTPCMIPDKTIIPSYNVDVSNPRLFGMQTKNSFLEHGNLVNKNSSHLDQNKVINPCEINHSESSYSHNEKDSSFNPMTTFCQNMCSSIATKKSETGQDIFLGQRNSELGESSIAGKSNSDSSLQNELNPACNKTVTNVMHTNQNPSSNAQADLFLGGQTGDTNNNSVNLKDNITDREISSKISSSSVTEIKNPEIPDKIDDNKRISENEIQTSQKIDNLISDTENSFKICNSAILIDNSLNSDLENKINYKHIASTSLESVDSVPSVLENSTINTEQMQELGMKEVSLNNKSMFKEKIYSSECKDFNSIVSKSINSSKQIYNGFSVSRILDNVSSPDVVNTVVAKIIDNKENVSYSSPSVTLDNAKSGFKNCDKGGLLPKLDDCEKDSSHEKLKLNRENFLHEDCSEDSENVEKTKCITLRISKPPRSSKLEDPKEVDLGENNQNIKQYLPEHLSGKTKSSRKGFPKKKIIQTNSNLNNKSDDQNQADDLKLDINSNIEKTFTENKIMNGGHCVEDQFCQSEDKFDHKEAQENEEYFVNTKQEDATKAPGRLRLRDTPKTSVKRVCPCCVDSRVPKKCRAPKVHSTVKSKGTLKTRNTSNIQNAKVNTRSSQRLRSRNNNTVN